MIFSRRLKGLREEKQISQRELAKLLNMAPSTLAMYEIGKREPDYDTLKMFAEFFNVTTDYLIGRTDDLIPLQYENIDEVEQLKEELHKRPELKILFDTSKNAKKEDIEKAASYIEFLKQQSEGS